MDEIKEEHLETYKRIISGEGGGWTQGYLKMAYEGKYPEECKKMRKKFSKQKS